MKLKKTIPFVLFFLILFIFPTIVHARIQPVNIRTDLALITNCRDLNCLNSTETDSEIYCYAMCSGNAGSENIYRWNETLENQVFCSIQGIKENSGGIIVPNTSYAFTSILSSSQLNRWNISQIGSSNCSLSGTLGNPLGINTYGGDFFSSSRWLYWSRNLATNEAGTGVQSAYWSDLLDLTIPNRSSNNSIWVGRGIITNYVGGSNNSVMNLGQYYNFSGGVRGIGMVEQAGTTWLYMITTGSDSSHWNLYKFNFSAGLVGSPTFFTSPNILNATYSDGPHCLGYNITTSLNGTVVIYLDGVNVQNHSVTTAPINNIRYEYCQDFPPASYNYDFEYHDSQSDIWVSNTIYFSTQETGFLALFGGFFQFFLNLDSLEQGKAVFLILGSLLFSLAFVIMLKARKDQATEVFLASFFSLMLLFTYTGDMPLIIGLPILILIGLMLAKTFQHIFLGGR